MKNNALDLSKGTIITSRVRLARNIKGLPFNIKDPEIASRVVNKVYGALNKVDTFSLYSMSKLPMQKLEAMKEQHLISQNLIDNRACGAAIINSQGNVSIMVNEEDVLRLQCFKDGFALTEAYDKINEIDDELAKNIDIIFDEEWGYLTACPSNVGTGLRASVMLFLPALTENKQIKYMVNRVAEKGLTVRGLYGEGSKAEGCIYQVSNELTLGLSERQIIDNVEDAVRRICEAESLYMGEMYSNREMETLDRVKKSYGVLTNAVLLPYEEFMHHASNVKLGIIMGFCEQEKNFSIDDLMVKVRPYSLCELCGRELSPRQRDLYRAEYVGGRLKKLLVF